MEYQNGLNAPNFSGAFGQLGQLGALGKLGAQAAAEHPWMETFRDYCAAKRDFDNACHDLVRAQQMRSATEQKLNELSKQIDEIIRHGVIDPTAPPTPQPAAKAYRG